MHAEWMDHVESMVYRSRIKVPYNWSVGDTGSRFLCEIRDHKRILGKRCETCEAVYVPPKKMCPRCFQDTGAWVEVGPQGTVTAFTVVRYDNTVQPAPTPFAYAVIVLEGSTTGFVHILGEADLDAVRVGMRVEPVFKEERSGHILDISHFRPA